MPASFTRAQNGSKAGSPGVSGPSAVNAAAGRITIVRAPWSSAHSSSCTAQSTSPSEKYGAAKILSSYAKPQSSASHRLNAVNRIVTASGSSLRSSS